MNNQLLSETQIQNVVGQYLIEDIKDIQIIRNHSKVLVKLVTANDGTFYLKGEQGERVTVERKCNFASILQQFLPVTSYFKTKDNQFTVDYANFIFTLEGEMQGIEVQQLTDLHLMSIAKTLAKLHSIGLEKGLVIGSGTSWGMFGGNETDELGQYDENELSFLNFKNSFSEASQFEQIEYLYLQKRNKLRALWPTLPCCATQGDLCYYNLLFKEDGQIAAIFDFNLAGDEVCINEAVALGVYCCWIVDYCGEKSSAERYQLFMDSYRSIRPLTNEEQQAEKWLFPIIRAFRYDRIDDGIENTSSHNEFIAETLELLKS